MSAKPEAKEEGGKKKKKPLPLIIGIVVLVVALFVGKTVMAKGKDAKEGTKKSKSSKSSKHHDDEEEEEHGKKSKKKSHDEDEDVKVGHSLQLDEFLVNLHGGGDHYLKASLALGLKEGMTEEKAKELIPMARDIIISALSEKTIKDLSTNEGRDTLKEELLEKINEEAGEEAAEPVVKIYITAFATQ